MGKSKAAPERVTAAERRVQALELRKVGFTYRRIGEQLGVTESAAHKMVTKSLRELNEKSAESAEELRRLELERLDEWLLRVAQEIKSGKALGAIDRGLRIMNRRAKLLGLDALAKLLADAFDKKKFDEVTKAAGAGDKRAALVLEKFVSGEDFATASFGWSEGHPLILVKEKEAAVMTEEELAKAAQGRLTFEELAAIRKRVKEDEADAEA